MAKKEVVKKEVAKKEAPKKEAPKKDGAKKKGGKLDSGRIKEFMVAKGERVGLGVAAAIMLLLLISGISMGLGSSSQHQEVKKAAQALMSRVNAPKPDQAPAEDDKNGEGKIKVPTLPKWSAVSPNAYPVRSFFDAGAIEDDKVYNPFALALVGSEDDEEEKAKVIKLEVMRGAVKVYEKTIKKDGIYVVKEGAGGAAAPGVPPPMPPAGSPMPGMPAGSAIASLNPAFDIKARRMIVVTGMFPYQKQLKVFQKALRKNSIEDVLADEKIAPKFLGLNVIRVEAVDGEWTNNWKQIFFKGPGDKQVTVMKEWKDLVWMAQFDTAEYAKVSKYVKPGLVTPLPELAYVKYPEIDLPGIKAEKVATDGTGSEGLPGTSDPKIPMPMPNPMIGGTLPGAEPGVPKTGGIVTLKDLSFKNLAKVDKVLADRLEFGKFSYFDPYGDPEGAKKAAAAMYPGSVVPGMPPTGYVPPTTKTPKSPGDGVEPPGAVVEPGGMPMTPGSTEMSPTFDIPEHLLVRFVDTEVEAGKTYKYYIQVRLENPNFGKKDKVALPPLAEIQEIVSPWTETPSEYVEEEFYYYFVDQFQHPDVKAKKLHPITKDTAQGSTKGKELIAVQLHRWVEQATHPTTNTKEKVGSWAVADRVLVGKGQYFGKSALEVPLPYWNNKKNRFELPAPKDKEKPKMVEKTPVQVHSGLKVEFVSKKGAPLVVDFKGGESDFWMLPNNDFTSDKSAVDVLVLSPDGKLLSFNSREDSDPDSDRGHERVQNYRQWQKSIAAPDVPANTGGPGSPPGPGALPGVGAQP